MSAQKLNLIKERIILPYTKEEADERCRIQTYCLTGAARYKKNMNRHAAQSNEVCQMINELWRADGLCIYTLLDTIEFQYGANGKISNAYRRALKIKSNQETPSRLYSTFEEEGRNAFFFEFMGLMEHIPPEYLTNGAEYYLGYGNH